MADFDLPTTPEESERNDGNRLPEVQIAFREILDKLPIAIYITDKNGCLTYYNEEAVAFTGRVPKIGSDHWSIVWKLYTSDGKFLPPDKSPMAIALKEGRPVSGGEVLAELPNGIRKWFTPFPILLFDADGKVKGAFNLMLDITERKSNQHSDALLRAIIESSDDAIISKNLNGIITSWNASAERIFGYSAQEAIGKSITMLIPDDRLDEEKIILEELKSGKRIEHFETIRIRKDGSPLHISLTISPIRGLNGDIKGASKVARDITENKLAETKLRSMNEELEDRVQERTSALLSYQEQLKSLSSKLSKAEDHERQRLATILHDNLGQILALSKMKLDQMLKEQLPERASTEAIEMSVLIENAIKFTRELMSDLKPPPSLEKESLAGNIRWVANKMKKHNLQVTIEEDDQPKAVSEEVRRTLYQCVRELLFNVIKHAKVKKAHINISRNHKHLQIIIKDEGDGFELNDTIPAPTKDGGFGLFNIHERMDTMGGSMEIATEPGKGTEITLNVPLKVEKNAKNSPPAIKKSVSLKAKSKSKDKQNKIVKVLLVDDHEMVRAGLKNLIEEQGDLKVIAEAVNGKDAIEKSRISEPDVIVMDINMPVMDGIEATQIIALDNPKVRIIGLSLHTREDVKEAMKRAGAVAYLSKTEAFESLSAVIRSEATKAKNHNYKSRNISSHTL